MKNIKKRITESINSKHTSTVSMIAGALVVFATVTPNCWMSFLGQPKMPKHLIKED